MSSSPNHTPESIIPADGSRDRIKTVLSQPHSNEQLAESLKLREQYAERVEMLKYYGFTLPDGRPKEGDVLMPSAENIIASFTTEELQIASKYKEPMLIIVPQTSFQSKVRLFDSKNEEVGLKDMVHFDEIFRVSDKGSEKIKGWSAFIVEGSSELDIAEADNASDSYLSRSRVIREKRLPGERGTDRDKELITLMEQIRLQKNIRNTHQQVVLDDDYETTSEAVLMALYVTGVDRISFLKVKPASVNTHARFRSSVGAEGRL